MVKKEEEAIMGIKKYFFVFLRKIYDDYDRFFFFDVQGSQRSNLPTDFISDVIVCI